MTESTKVAIRPPTNEAIEQIRKAGKKQTALIREANQIAKAIEGMEWGGGKSVIHGSSFSDETRFMLAKFCVVTRANPLTHVDILGGKPYLNSQYWSDKVNEDQYFHHYEQREIGPVAEKQKREQAQKARNLAAELRAAGNRAQDAAQWESRALEMELEADTMASDRAKWNPRPTATSVVETTIWRFINAAPVEKIRSGEITDIDKYLVPVQECNWAGGMGNTMADKKKWDPIGDANPGSTARTRSLRRCSVKAFSAWMGEYTEQINKAEKAIEAEWETVSNGHGGEAIDAEAVAITSDNGEAEATTKEGAVDLPSYGEEPSPPPPTPDPEPEPEPEATFDENDARKRFFATFRDAGYEEKDRKLWAKEQNLPESTSEWGEDEYERAQTILITPWKTKVETGCEALGLHLDDLSLKVLKKGRPEYLKDYRKLVEHMQSMAKKGADV